jgi:hypothetical protein
MESDLEAVARTYREVRWAGGMDSPARLAAKRAYCAVHSDADADPETSRRVAALIHEAGARGMLWPFVDGWEGCIVWR